MAKKPDDCHLLYTICLTRENTDTVETFQTFVKQREKKPTFNKSQVINRIIREWSEDRHLTLEVSKKSKML